MNASNHDNENIPGASVNLVILSGTVDSMPKINTASNSSQYAVWSIAVSKLIKSRETDEMRQISSWYNLISYNQNIVDICSKLKKGDEILIQGSLNVRTWVDQDSNQKRTKYEINVEKISKSSSGSAGRGNSNSNEDMLSDAMPF